MHTLNKDNPWWVVDLESTCTIDTVKIYNRIDCKYSVKATIPYVRKHEGLWHAESGIPFSIEYNFLSDFGMGTL